MSRTGFRALLLVYIACFVVSLIAVFMPADFSDQLAEAYYAEPQVWLARNESLLFAVGVVSLCAFAFGLWGLFRFKRWGRTLSFYSTVAGLILLPFMGPDLSSSFESTIAEISAMTWGAILAVAYFSPLGDLFDKPAAGITDTFRESA